MLLRESRKRQKNITADKVEIGEKGLGFKSVFGIADRVLIQSGMFSFELEKNNFTIPVPRYENFKPVKGTRLELQMPASSCKNIFEGLVREYRSRDSLLNKNPILFLNKLTHLKMYFDNFRYIEFDVQRSNPEHHGTLLVETKAAISVDMRYHTSSFDVAPHKETINCYRYTKPIVYREKECLSRYGKDAAFSVRRHNLIAVFPVADDEASIKQKQGLLYSFLPTQIKTNAPIILHVPFKLDGSREFVDPQGKNAWFEYTKNELIEFIRDVYIDLSRNVKQNIIRYLPSIYNYLFRKDNEKVECLCVDGLHGRDLCREKIFFTEENQFECADHIVTFGKDSSVDDQLGAYVLLNENRKLFIPPFKTDMKQYGAKVIEDIAGALFHHALLDDKRMGEILEWLEKSNIEINYTKLLTENCPVTFSSTSLSVIGKYSRFINAIQQIASKSIKENKKPPFHIAEGTRQVNQAKKEEIISLVHDADINRVFERYLKNRNYCFYTFPSETEFAVIADNGIALTYMHELGAFAKASEPFDSRGTFSAALKIRQASNTLDQADESMDNSEYLKLLRGVRSSLKKAFGDRMYNSYVSIIAEAGADKNRFLSELLQNADDCRYADGIEPEFILRLNGDKLEISYNEIGFSKRNVRALTAIGESTKKQLLFGNDRSIGEKGVGFKSVFGVAEQVEIHSNGFDFRLTDKQPTIPEKCAAAKGSVGTKMIFKMKSDVQESFSAERILKLCNCLHNLKHIEIAEHKVKIEDNVELKRRIITVDGKKYDFTRFVYDFRITDQTALSQRNAQNRVIKPEQRIIIYVPKNMKERDFYVYSGLPIEIKSTVPLIIDAPFELTTSRENILKNRWNEIICDEIYNAITSFMKASCNLGLDILSYVGFTSQNGSYKFENFTDDYLNKSDYWLKELKYITFIPVVGSERRVSPVSSCILVPEFIAKVIEDTSLFNANVVNISGKSRYTAILELIGCKRASGAEIYNCLSELVQNHITDSEFRSGLYSYLANNRGNLGFESIGERVLRLPIFPVKTTDGTKYINFKSNIYTHETRVSHGDYFILDTEIMKIEQADAILSGYGRITPLTQEVYDAKYQKNIEALIENSGNRYSQKYIAEYLLKEYKQGTIKKFRNVLLGMKKKIPMLMTDGQYKTGSKYLNDGEQWFGGTLIRHLIVEQTYRDFAKFLEAEDIRFIHAEGFDFEIDDVSDEDIRDVEYLNNYSEIIKYLFDKGFVSDEQISKYNLEFVETENEYDEYGDEDFPKKKVSNPDKLKKHVCEQWKNKIPYVEKRYIVWKPNVSFDSKSYTTNMYRSAINSKKCFCQMCREKFDFRYIERNSIERNPAYAWGQMYLSLCLCCSKDYIVLRNNEVIWRKFIDEIMSADATEYGVIDISIGERTISFTATHLAEIREIFRTQGWGENAPKREPKLGKSEGNEDDVDNDNY